MLTNGTGLKSRTFGSFQLLAGPDTITVDSLSRPFVTKLEPLINYMIIDPIQTRLQALLTAGLTSENINLDKVSNESTKCTWRGNSTTTPGLRLDGTTSHDVTKAGRRRSMLRVDATYVDSSVSPAATYKASAYVVLDQVDVPSTKDITTRNAALSAVLHALVGSRTAGSAEVPMQTMLDWLNGEP